MIEQSRQAYRRDNPKKRSKLHRAPLIDGKEIEVQIEGVDYPMVIEVYTIPEMAKSLDRSVLTVKKWIKEKMIPPPVIRDTSHGYSRYSRGEVDVIVKCLLEHEKGYDYLHKTHIWTINRIRECMRQYRLENV